MADFQCIYPVTGSAGLSPLTEVLLGETTTTSSEITRGAINAYGVVIISMEPTSSDETTLAVSGVAERFSRSCRCVHTC